ncbi:hypothetical protein SBOR_4736 [Sclerotinia borealis F-4128]|uniref:Uncharacterized protein n=1 Tax=Sclerotinia borealis (strain F-4128) TaxID=1432307 RepID=W9CK30_SCLBF|nr:hypothetical protein SBOR_4736 [Sclerotinia borealis F-4128]
MIHSLKDLRVPLSKNLKLSISPVFANDKQPSYCISSRMGCGTSRPSTPSNSNSNPTPQTTRSAYIPRTSSSSSLHNIRIINLASSTRTGPTQDINGLSGFLSSSSSQQNQLLSISSSSWPKSYSYSSPEYQPRQISGKFVPVRVQQQQQQQPIQDINGYSGILVPNLHRPTNTATWPRSQAELQGHKQMQKQRQHQSIARKPLPATGPPLGVDRGRRRAGGSFSNSNSNSNPNRNPSLVLPMAGAGHFIRSPSPVSPVDTKKWDF